MELLKGKDKLVELLNETLRNEKYQKQAQRIKHLLETKPFSANEIFVKNVEFVLANGGKLPELKPASLDLSFIQQHNLDVYVIAIIAVNHWHIFEYLFHQTIVLFPFKTRE